MWFAIPSSYDSFIHYSSPVFTGAIGTPYLIIAFLKISNYYQDMARISGAVVPVIPHHITQRG
jgi:hypothetical protein